MEVELSGLLRSMTNNQQRSAFFKNVDNATKMKANNNLWFACSFAGKGIKAYYHSRLTSLLRNTRTDRIKRYRYG